MPSSQKQIPLDVTSANGITTGETPTANDVVTFMTHVDADGKINSSVDAAVKKKTAKSKIEAHKFGTTQTGKSGGTVNYYFDKGSNWTDAEKTTFKTAFDLWSNIANIEFAEASSPEGIKLKRGTDRKAFTSHASPEATVGETRINAATSALISIDTNTESFRDFSISGYGFELIIHEIGHALGFEHSGNYNGSVNVTTEQNGPYDTRQWTVMSYIGANDKKAEYYGTTGLTVNWPFGQTPMMLDVVAAQRLYGKPVSGALQGGQTFGFNSNISGLAKGFFDFGTNASPRVTIYDAGINNTLDLSGWSKGAAISLIPGTFTSASADGKMTNNIGIALGTSIETVIGTKGDDTIITNPDLHSIISGGGGNDIFESTKKGFSGAIFKDFGAGDAIHFTDATVDAFAFSQSGQTLTASDHLGSYTMTLSDAPGAVFMTADADGSVNLNFASIHNGTLDLSSGNGLTIDLASSKVLAKSSNGKAPLDTGLVIGDDITKIVATKANDVLLADLKKTNFVFTGNGGNDLFEGTMSSFNGTTITDFNIGDTLHFTDANADFFKFIDNHTRLNFGEDNANSYTLNLPNDPLGTFAVKADAKGGVDIALEAPIVANHTIDLSSGNRLKINLAAGTVESVSTDGAISDTGFTLTAKPHKIIATTGDDTITLKTSGYNYTLTGNGGNDVFEGTAHNFASTTITDLDVGDSIHFTDLDPKTFEFSDNGNSLTFNDAKQQTRSMHFSNDLLGSFSASSNVNGGVNLTLVANHVLV